MEKSICKCVCINHKNGCVMKQKQQPFDSLKILFLYFQPYDYYSTHCIKTSPSVQFFSSSFLFLTTISLQIKHFLVNTNRYHITWCAGRLFSTLLRLAYTFIVNLSYARIKISARHKSSSQKNASHGKSNFVSDQIYF